MIYIDEVSSQQTVLEPYIIDHLFIDQDGFTNADLARLPIQGVVAVLMFGNVYW